MKIKSNEKFVVIDDEICWICGNEFKGIDALGQNDKTEHHAIPKVFSPVKNAIIPICFDCHNKIHKKLTSVNAIKTKVIGLKKYIDELNKMLEETK